MKVRIYLRRSKNDRDKQQFSLDVQREGAERFASEEFPDAPIEVYVDDGKAGDEFLNRPGLKRLIADCESGDVVIARDQSRLGRDALEVSLVIRDLVQDRSCRIFYYVSRHEVAFGNAIEQATTYIQGTGHQLELEAIRSRTTEALRAKVRAGRVAGGRCYGYELVRKTDATGRQYTLAKVDEQQAAIVRKIFSDYVFGRGLKAIAKELNDKAVPCPTVGRRGTGIWAPSAIRAMLLNPRYRGLYVHGRIKKVRRRGKLVRIKADPSEVITLDMPEWRIVDDETWLAVQEKFAARRRDTPPSKRTKRAGPACKYILSGIGRCGECGRAIGVMNTKRNQTIIKAYGCTGHHYNGNAVCRTSLRESMEAVDDRVIGYLQDAVLTPEVFDQIMSDVREVLEVKLGEDRDVTELEERLAATQAAVNRLVQLGALAGDGAMADIASELRRKTELVKRLEISIGAAKRAPAETANLMANIERRAAARLEDLARELRRAEPIRKRGVLQAVFESGLTFESAPRGATRRKTWAIRGIAQLPRIILRGDPNGI